MRSRLGHRVDRLARSIVARPSPEFVFDAESIRRVDDLVDTILASDDPEEAAEMRQLVDRMHEEIGAPAAAEARGAWV
jgi:hypothetical protein